MQQRRRGMAEERFDGHAAELVQELAHVSSLVGQELAQVDTAEKDEGLHAHRDASDTYQ